MVESSGFGDESPEFESRAGCLLGGWLTGRTVLHCSESRRSQRYFTDGWEGQRVLHRDRQAARHGGGASQCKSPPWFLIQCLFAQTPLPLPPLSCPGPSLPPCPTPDLNRCGQRGTHRARRRAPARHVYVCNKSKQVLAISLIRYHPAPAPRLHSSRWANLCLALPESLQLARLPSPARGSGYRLGTDGRTDTQTVVV